MAYAVRICTGTCVEDACPCTPRVCDNFDILEGEAEHGEPEVWVERYAKAAQGDVDPGRPLVDDPGFPYVSSCVHGQLGVRYGHPATETDGTVRLVHMNDHPDEDCLHEWADGDTNCKIIPYTESKPS